MSNLNVSAGMAQAIQTVLQQESITEFTVDLQITNLNDSTYSFTPSWLDQLIITQDYANNFADDVELTFTAGPDDYMELFNNSMGLQVSMRIVFVNSQTAQRVFTPPPIARTYKAMLKDPQDLSKKYTTGALKPTARMPLTEQHVSTRIPVKLHLIESAAYTLRQQQFHSTYKNNTVAQVIAHITKSFSINQLYMVAPDNTMAWSHITVPPSQNIDVVFDYLQFTYGVYMKGIDWYYTNNMLYLYPAYENNPVIKYTADIYNAPDGDYGGMLSYHILNTASNNIGIVSTSKVKTTDISRPSAENAGTGASFMRASSVIDRYSTTNAQGTFINTNNSLTVGSPTDRTISAQANNPKYSKTTDNIFLESSKIAKWNAVLLECDWKSAIPFQIYPGHNTKYHFDKDGTFTFQQGIMEKIVYTFERKRKTAVGNVYAGNATINLRANSDVTNAAQTATA